MAWTHIDLFAGIGGFRLAATRNGGRCIGYSEISPDAVSAYEANYADAKETNFGDITKLKKLPPHDFLTGGVPCQSWSIAGRNLGFDDDRGQLWNDAIFLLNQSRPKAFLFENVKGLVDPRNKSALDYIMRRIAEAGYHASVHVLNSFDYGVPQSRVRIYIVGFADKKQALRGGERHRAGRGEGRAQPPGQIAGGLSGEVLSAAGTAHLVVRSEIRPRPGGRSALCLRAESPPPRNSAVRFRRRQAPLRGGGGL